MLRIVYVRTRGWRYAVICYAVVLVTILLAYVGITVPPESCVIAIFVGWGATLFHYIYVVSKEEYGLSWYGLSFGLQVRISVEQCLFESVHWTTMQHMYFTDTN